MALTAKPPTMRSTHATQAFSSFVAVLCIIDAISRNFWTKQIKNRKAHCFFWPSRVVVDLPGGATANLRRIGRDRRANTAALAAGGI